MKYLSFAFIVLALINQVHAQNYSSLSQAEESGFYQELQQAVTRAEDSVKRLKTQATRTDMSPMWNTKLELENAVIQLEVKKTLVNNFRGTESLRSELVRRKLLDVLNKSVITTADLADLQTTVLEEKAKIRAEAQREAQTLTPQNSLETRFRTTPQLQR